MLTPEQQALRDEIAVAKCAHEEANRAYWDAKNRCKEHVFKNCGDEAICTICGENGGWWCPDSADHVCEYDRNECCVHCGAPEERK